MPEWCPTAFARLEIHGCIVRRTLLPTPLKEAAPLEGSGAHGRLGRLAFVALLLRIDWGPAGLPWGCRRPRHARVAPARRPREAPGPPGLLATACRDRRGAPGVAGGAASRGQARPSAPSAGVGGAPCALQGLSRPDQCGHPASRGLSDRDRATLADPQCRVGAVSVSSPSRPEGA